MAVNIAPLEGMEVRGKTVILRLDINCPIDPATKKIASDNRIKKSLPTLEYLQKGGAKIALIAHQGDTLDYQNLIPLEEHAQRLAALTGKPVRYIDDVCGPAALEAVKGLGEGETVLLGNLRYLGEELSTFEKDVKLTPEAMADTWLIRRLAPLADLYVNDAFSAAHRSCPSMVGFQEVLPSAAGPLFFNEIKALSQVMHSATRPTVFVLGGAKISDAFGMMEEVLRNGVADRILTTGVTGQVFLLAGGADLGQKTLDFLGDRDLMVFVEPAKKYLAEFGDRVEVPRDLAFEEQGNRREIQVAQLPQDALYCDIGETTIAEYRKILLSAGTIFANGPAGVYEDTKFEAGTKGIWQAITDSPAYSVIGGGDSVSSASRYVDMDKISYVCTAGGAMVRFMSGGTLPLVAAMERANGRLKR